jgi:hypothetical protein
MTDEPVTNLDRAVDGLVVALAALPDLRTFAREHKQAAGLLDGGAALLTDEAPPMGAVLASLADVALEVHRLNEMKGA